MENESIEEWKQKATVYIEDAAAGLPGFPPAVDDGVDFEERETIPLYLVCTEILQNGK